MAVDPQRLRRAGRGWRWATKLGAGILDPGGVSAYKTDDRKSAVERLYPPGSLARPGWYIPTPSNFQLPWQVGASDVD